MATAALLPAACGGGQDRLTDREFTARMNSVVERISGEFGAVFTTLGRAEETDRVPAPVRDRLLRAARTERKLADTVQELEPPERAEAAHDALVTGARRQADTLERLAADPRLTVAQMADAVEGGETTAALQRLAEAGYVNPPQHS